MKITNNKKRITNLVWRTQPPSADRFRSRRRWSEWSHLLRFSSASKTGRRSERSQWTSGQTRWSCLAGRNSRCYPWSGQISSGFDRPYNNLFAISDDLRWVRINQKLNFLQISSDFKESVDTLKNPKMTILTALWVAFTQRLPSPATVLERTTQTNAKKWKVRTFPTFYFCQFFLQALIWMLKGKWLVVGEEQRSFERAAGSFLAVEVP